MNTLGAKSRRGRGGYFFALGVLAIFALAACWALATLFPVELRQAGQWIGAMFESMRN